MKNNRKILGYRIIKKKYGFILQYNTIKIVGGTLGWPMEYWEDSGSYKTLKQAKKAKEDLMMENDDFIVD